MPTKTDDQQEGVESKSALVPAMDVFVANLKAAMDAKNMSQVELSSKTQISRPSLNRLLSGKGGNCTIYTASLLADAIGMPLWKLMRPTKEN